jgi:hypothetical protein
MQSSNNDLFLCWCWKIYLATVALGWYSKGRILGSIPTVARHILGSIPTVARHIFQAFRVWIYTQSNNTNIIFTSWIHNTNTEKNHDCIYIEGLSSEISHITRTDLTAYSSVGRALCKGRIFDSHRGQAYFSSLSGVDIHALRVTSQTSYHTLFSNIFGFG